VKIMPGTYLVKIIPETYLAHTKLYIHIFIDIKLQIERKYTKVLNQ
jgi:hypothetical protein